VLIKFEAFIRSALILPHFSIIADEVTWKF